MNDITSPRTASACPDRSTKFSWIRFIVLALLLLSRGAFAAEEWTGLPFAEVRAYAWPADTNGRQVILPGIKLREDVLNKEGALLNDDQIKRLQAAVTGKHTQHALMRCYSPHNAFVFYDSAKKPVAFVEICFDCLGTATQPKSSAEWKDFPGLAKIFFELKLPVGHWPSLEKFNQFFESAKREKVPSPQH
ncbi:hypothetical protein [Haloferula sp. BvORR071]|uniref:hypothetical protein n=1 Tax=Haloferula sp. BvORR071 TaxID=1396141 RepID=UPI002240FF4B|nr:hypothetical protein [Haloferula sp. BvORR071]